MNQRRNIVRPNKAPIEGYENQSQPLTGKITSEGLKTFRGYDELNQQEKLIVLTTYLRTFSKKRTCNLCKVNTECLNNILTEYYFVIRDIENDNQITEKIHKELTHQVDMSLDISSKILNIYNRQVDRISKAFEDNDRLVNDYLMQQLSMIFTDVNTLVKLQIDLEEKHKNSLVGIKGVADARRTDNVEVDSDYYMQNQLTVLAELEKKSPRIVVEDMQTGERLFYKNIYEASHDINVDDKSITELLRDNREMLTTFGDKRKFKIYYEEM